MGTDSRKRAYLFTPAPILRAMQSQWHQKSGWILVHQLGQLMSSTPVYMPTYGKAVREITCKRVVKEVIG